MQRNLYSSNGAILMMSLHGYVGAEPELGKPDTGGQVVYVLELAKQFSQMGYKVDLVTRRFEDQPEYDEVNENCRVWRIPFGGKNFIRKEDMHDHLDEFVANFLARVAAGGGRYTVVYSHYWDAGWAGQQIAEELGIPHVHTPHSLGWWKRTDMGSKMSEEEMEKAFRFEQRIRKEFLVYRSCSHVIATTEQQTQILRDQYDILERHMTVVPAGLDEGRFTPVRQEIRRKLQERYNFTEKDVFIVGRMAENKGYDLLLRSLPTLITAVPEARLVAGIGSDNSKKDAAGVAELKKLAQQIGVNDHIVWANYIHDDDLANNYRSASVFAMSSRYEPFGMVAIEAMACGTPSVVSVHSGLAQLLDFGTQALVADPERATEYGTMLSLPMLYPRLANELSVEGSRFARRNFGWQGIARRILAIFERSKMESPIV